MVGSNQPTEMLYLTLLKRPMTQKQPKLTKDVHMRVSEPLQMLIHEIANQNHMKPSSLCRVILERSLPQYTRNRFFG